MPLTVLVDREERIALSHAGDVGLLIFEPDISALFLIHDFSSYRFPVDLAVQWITVETA
jgi:hypothetical protein